MSSLLPPNATQLERNLEQVMRYDLPVPIRELWSVEDCPEHMLPWLGWTLGADFWALADTPRKRRDLIKNAIAWHKKRGTPWAVKQALAAFGYEVEKLLEQGEYRTRWLAAGGKVLDGSWIADGSYELSWTADLPDDSDLRRLSLGHWAEYAIRVSSSESWSRDDQVRVRQIAEMYAPARSQLVAIIGSLLMRFDCRVRMHAMRYRLNLDFKRCQTLSIHGRRTLSGCWAIGGGTQTNYLDGWLLNNLVTLDGQRATSGFDWAAGQMGLHTTLRMHQGYAMSAAPAPVRLCGLRRTLAGGWHLGEKTLTGHDLLASQRLDGPLLTHSDAPALDGWSFGQPAPKKISHTLRLHVRHMENSHAHT